MAPKLPKVLEKGQVRLNMGESIDNIPIQPSLPSEPSKKRKISSEDDASSASQPAQKKTVSNTLSELRELVDPPLARQALQQLVNGNGGDFGPAIRNADGCLLAQKSSSHQTGGYIQVHMPYEKRARGKNGETVTRRQAQLAHRVVVIAYKVSSPTLLL